MLSLQEFSFLRMPKGRQLDFDRKVAHLACEMICRCGFTTTGNLSDAAVEFDLEATTNPKRSPSFKVRHRTAKRASIEVLKQLKEAGYIRTQRIEGVGLHRHDFRHGNPPGCLRRYSPSQFGERFDIRCILNARNAELPPRKSHTVYLHTGGDQLAGHRQVAPDWVLQQIPMNKTFTFGDSEKEFTTNRMCLMDAWIELSMALPSTRRKWMTLHGEESNPGLPRVALVDVKKKEVTPVFYVNRDSLVQSVTSELVAKYEDNGVPYMVVNRRLVQADVTDRLSRFFRIKNPLERKATNIN